MPGTDHTRFTALIEPHLEALFRAAWRLARNRADAEDLVQETCVRACERLGELRETGEVKAWLLRVMHNLFIDGARRARNSPLQVTGDGPDHALANPGPTPEESLDRDQHLARLERAWVRLEHGHRVLLALRAEGYTLAEISEITHIAIDALTMRLYRARQNLARRLQQEPALPTAMHREAAK